MMTMEDLFFSHYNNPTPKYRPRRKTPLVRKVKVASIPVQSAKSKKNKAAAAVKIQKVFRGYLVRNSVKKLVEIKREVDEIERRISQKETLALIKKDPKERLKVNEMLMALLLRLDSVRGVDGVRDLRKAVIRKAIVLEEKVDTIAAEKESETKARAAAVIDHAPDVSDPFPKDLAQKNTKSQLLEPLIVKTGDMDEDARRDDIEKDKLIEQLSALSMGTNEEELGENKAEDDYGVMGKGEDVSSNMMEKNEKLMDMVKELCEKEAMQAKLISSLLRSIECLEELYEREELQAKSISSLEQRVESLVLRDEVRRNAEKRLWEAVYQSPTANGF